ncbi:MAG TPA: SH3 domain-containing protein [Tepidisphaeraceae bacterium]|nr:SH3 domain-containing protein [Tepidisphaeraceae bacterium]
MATRPTLLSALLISTFFAAAPALAADEQPQVENAKFQFSGLINASAVVVHSGPAESYYITGRLDKGAPVTVVGIKFEWLKIVPPEGSFSVVAKNLVTRDGAAPTGRINADNVNVRAGSSVVPLKITVQCKLPKGAEVSIVGEDDAYYQIKPPADAYLYVHQKFVDPVKQVAVAPVKSPANPIEKKTETKPDDEKIELVQNPPRPLEQPGAESLANPINPIEVPKPLSPTTRPISIQAEFDRLESEFSAMAGRSLDELPIPTLLAGYEGLLRDDHLPITMRRVAQAKAASLRVKAHARAELLALRKSQEESESKLAALRGERTEIQARLTDQIIAYTAVGTLKPSTVQIGAQTLYRLTDPASGRTLCYVRSSDAKFGAFLEKFVGIKGDLVSEPQLSVKALLATDVAAVDPAEVTRKVSAQIIPPSLLTAKPPAPAQASTGGAQ